MISTAIGFVFLGIGAVLFWKANELKKASRPDDAGYGKALVLLSRGFAKVHSLKKKKEKVTSEELKVILRAFCDLLSSVYYERTGYQCGVSIKVVTSTYSSLEQMSLGMEVINIVRDSKSRKRDNSKYSSTRHLIQNNTCYQSIISNFLADKKEKLFFLHNDLPSYQGYENSSFKVRGELSEIARTNESQRRKEWRLGYKSEIVVALSPLEWENVHEMQVVGFICVDCPMEGNNIFNKDYDVPLLRGVADGIYDLVKEHFFEKDADNEETLSRQVNLREIPSPTSKPTNLRKNPKHIEERVKILFLMANPESSTRLKLDEELRRVKDGLAGATNGGKFLLESESAVRINTITKAMQRIKPNIIHFSGHGSGPGGLVVLDFGGNAKFMPTEGINRLFKQFKEDIKCIECVVLNACYSKEQAKVISEHGIYVVGMSDEISDTGATEFSVGFYESLGEGNSYVFAFSMGMVSLSPFLGDCACPELWFNGEIIKS